MVVLWKEVDMYQILSFLTQKSVLIFQEKCGCYYLLSKMELSVRFVTRHKHLRLRELYIFQQQLLVASYRYKALHLRCLRDSWLYLWERKPWSKRMHEISKLYLKGSSSNFEVNLIALIDFYSTRNHQKNISFLKISGGIEIINSLTFA